MTIKDENRTALFGLGGACFVGAAMVAWPIFGDPPYAYFGPMKWVVGAISVFAAVAIWNLSRLLLPLTMLLVTSALIETFGKMRREEWIPFNWASLLLLSISAFVLFFYASRVSRNPDHERE